MWISRNTRTSWALFLMIRLLLWHTQSELVRIPEERMYKKTIQKKRWLDHSFGPSLNTNFTRFSRAAPESGFCFGWDDVKEGKPAAAARCLFVCLLCSRSASLCLSEEHCQVWFQLKFPVEIVFSFQKLPISLRAGGDPVPFLKYRSPGWPILKWNTELQTRVKCHWAVSTINVVTIVVRIYFLRKYHPCQKCHFISASIIKIWSKQNRVVWFCFLCWTTVKNWKCHKTKQLAT